MAKEKETFVSVYTSQSDLIGELQAQRDLISKEVDNVPDNVTQSCPCTRAHTQEDTLERVNLLLSTSAQPAASRDFLKQAREDGE